METMINGREYTIYPLIVDDGTSAPIGLCFMRGILNQYEGLNHYHLQVLKSAAGFYIGNITQSNWGTQDEPNMQWEPNMRDSQSYFGTRDEAEKALITGKYDVKF